MDASNPSASPTGASAESIDQHLSEVARRQLQSLRAAIGDRLAVLDAVLEDPSRGESLEELILDLARLATEEAQVATAKACVDTKLNADRESADVRAAAQATLDQERSVSAQLRQTLHEAQQRISTLENEKKTALRSAQEQLDRSATREHETVANAARAAEEADKQLRAERATVADLRKTAARVDALSAALEQQESKARTSIQQLATEVARERDAAADARQMLADSQAQLERAAIHERETVARLDQVVHEVQQQLAAARAAQERLEAERAQERDAAATASRALTEVTAQLEAERSSNVELRTVAQDTQRELAHAARDHAQGAEALSTALEQQESNARQKLTDSQAQLELAIIRERDTVARLEQIVQEVQQQLAAARGAQDRLEAELARERDAASSISRALTDATAQIEALEVRLIMSVPPSPAPGSAPAPSELESAAGDPDTTKAPQEDSAPASPPYGDDDGWSAVRLTNRYAFPKPVEVMANGESGLLLDLSESGCQLLSRGALTLNQAIRVVLPSEAMPVACAGKVVWARLEGPGGGRPLTYRAGVQFTRRDDEAIAAFVARHGAA